MILRACSMAGEHVPETFFSLLMRGGSKQRWNVRIEVNSAVRELAERSSLLDLGGLLSVL